MKESCFKGCFYSKVGCDKIVMLSLTQHLQRLPLSFINNMRGRFRIKYGMTPNLIKDEALNKGTFRAPLRSGFTLIELLVVVLIIGILAAIAVPQYKLAVAKTRYVQAMTLSDSFWQAAQRYHLETSTWPNNIDQLDIEMPAGGRFNADHSGVYFSWGVCLVRATSSTSGYSLCQISGGVMAYRTFAETKRYCRAYGEEDAFSHKVCKSVGGVDGSPNITEGYIQYRIP